MENKSKFWYLERFDLMKKMSMSEMKYLEKAMVMKKVEKDAFVFFPEKASQYVYFLKEGAVKITHYTEEGHEDIRYILNKGNIFGEMALVDNEDSRDHAIALENCLVCFIDVNTMKDMMLNNRALSIGIRKVIGLRIKKLERKLESMLYKDSKTRVVEFLDEFRQEYGSLQDDVIVAKNFLTHADFAKLTATSRQTVTTVFNELREKGLIDYDKHFMTFKSSKPLA